MDTLDKSQHWLSSGLVLIWQQALTNENKFTDAYMSPDLSELLKRNSSTTDRS